METCGWSSLPNHRIVEDGTGGDASWGAHSLHRTCPWTAIKSMQRFKNQTTGFPLKKARQSLKYETKIPSNSEKHIRKWLHLTLQIILSSDTICMQPWRYTHMHTHVHVHMHLQRHRHTHCWAAAMQTASLLAWFHSNLFIIPCLKSFVPVRDLGNLFCKKKKKKEKKILSSVTYIFYIPTIDWNCLLELDVESRLANLSECSGCYPGGTWVKISNADHALLFPFERPALRLHFPCFHSLWVMLACSRLHLSLIPVSIFLSPPPWLITHCFQPHSCAHSFCHGAVNSGWEQSFKDFWSMQSRCGSSASSLSRDWKLGTSPKQRTEAREGQENILFSFFMAEFSDNILLFASQPGIHLQAVFVGSPKNLSLW